MARAGRETCINGRYLTDFLRQNAENISEKPAVVFNGQSMSWQEIWEKVRSASSNLTAQLDGQRQQVVAILAPNSPEFLIAYLAVVHAGHIAMPLDITFKKLELGPIIKDVNPSLILALKDYSNLVEGNIQLIEDLLETGAREPLAGPQLPPELQVATLFLSSGTTGQPKAIPNTHSNILWDVMAIAKPMGWTVDDTVLITLHLSHRHGLVICFISALYHGNTVYLEERFSAGTALDLLESGKVTVYSAVPSIYESLVEYEPEKEFDLSRVRLFASSSSVLPPYLRQAFEKRFGRQILDRYGTSETGSIAIRRPDEADAFGDLLDGVNIRLEKGGEVALKSPGLFPGYYDNSKETTRSMTPDGWWLTGDIGELHEGKLKLKGRSKERITKSGYSIYPQEIEWALRQTPEIEEVSVVGVNSAQSVDDKVVAFYVGTGSPSSLADFSKANLPRSWRPDKFVGLKELPKGRTGKVLIAKLKEMAEQT